MADIKRSAVISECGRYRHILRRSWDASRPALTFIMLNPSTADADQDDPTIRKCIGFADRIGYGSIIVVNLFDYRATKPADLKRASFPSSAENGWWIAKAMQESAGDVICAWGVNARGLTMPVEVLRAIRNAGHVPYALRLTEDGIPWHPLMLPYSCVPVEIPDRSEGGER
ncbi:MAG: DUF1643 domain-containing protein [Burkholderiaceae bacterium]|nr:DUF1643 domain-containing protein [Burkholderiaceae bacterium]